jgi:hypothetical protein
MGQLAPSCPPLSLSFHVLLAPSVLLPLSVSSLPVLNARSCSSSAQHSPRALRATTSPPGIPRSALVPPCPRASPARTFLTIPCRTTQVRHLANQGGQGVRRFAHGRRDARVQRNADGAGKGLAVSHTDGRGEPRALPGETRRRQLFQPSCFVVLGCGSFRCRTLLRVFVYQAHSPPPSQAMAAGEMEDGSAYTHLCVCKIDSRIRSAGMCTRLTPPLPYRR